MSRFKYGLLVLAMIACASSIVIQKHRFLPRKLLPTVNNDIGILRIILHAESVSAILLRCHDRCAGPSEQVKHILARLTELCAPQAYIASATAKSFCFTQSVGFHHVSILSYAAALS